MYTIPAWFPHVALPLGAAYARVGRVTEALPLPEQAVAQTAHMPLQPYASSSLAALSEAYLLACRLDDAMPLAQRAFEVAQRYNERGHQARCLRLLGEIAAHHDLPEVESAEACRCAPPHYVPISIHAEDPTSPGGYSDDIEKNAMVR
jgi:tetratricopeptide (TPR) repeat protein